MELPLEIYISTSMVHTITKTTHYNFYGPMQKGRNEHIVTSIDFKV